MIRLLLFALALWPSIAWAQIVGIAPVVNDSGLTQETRLYYGKMTTGTTITRNFCIDAYVRALITSGSWNNSTVIYLHAANAQQTALLNLRNPGTYTATVVANGGSMGFTANSGFTSDGSAYIDSGFNPTTASGFGQDNNHVGIWTGTNTQLNNSSWGNTNNFITPRNTNNQVSARNSSSNVAVVANSSGSSIGYFGQSRSGSGSFKVYQDGATLATHSETSSGLTNANFFIAGRSSSVISTLLIRLTKWGTSLSDAEHLADYNAASAYLSCL